MDRSVILQYSFEYGRFPLDGMNVSDSIELLEPHYLELGMKPAMR